MPFEMSTGQANSRLPLHQFPDFWLQGTSLCADFREDGDGLFEVRHGGFGLASGMEHVSKIVVQCCFAVTIS